MSNTKEKAKELVDKFAMYLRANLRYDEEANEEAKQCALIAVDEILEICPLQNDWYWEEVKQEIKNIS